MPGTLGLPYFPLSFDKVGGLQGTASEVALARLRFHMASQGATDLLVLAHGWNNDRSEAEAMYASFLRAAAPSWRAAGASGAAVGRLAVVGVLWPSKKFGAGLSDARGAAEIGAPPHEALARELAGVNEAFDRPLSAAELIAATHRLEDAEDSDAVAARFIDTVRGRVRTDEHEPADASALFFALQAGELLDRLRAPLPDTLPGRLDEGGVAGAGVASRGPLALGGGVWSALAHALNYTTYYQMKTRAAQVGTNGLQAVCSGLQKDAPGLRVHAVGHSFGARLVTAMAASPGRGGVAPLASLSLLQAAFSHFAMAPRWNGRDDGAFRRVLTQGAVSGPIIVTCTSNDQAVGRAYPIASLLAGQVGSALGDADDVHGAMGRNGAQRTPEAVDLPMLPAGGQYALMPGRVHNLEASAFVSDHADITNAAVVHAVVSAMGMAGG